MQTLNQYSRRSLGGSWDNALQTRPVITNRRHQRKPTNNLLGVTYPAIRRLARRGGVRRIRREIYNETRTVIKQRLSEILRRVAAILELANRKIVRVEDILYTLEQLGTPIYGFEES